MKFDIPINKKTKRIYAYREINTFLSFNRQLS